MFTAFDYAVMAVIGLSALRGTWRGFLSEIFGLIGWIAAVFIACRFVGDVVAVIVWSALRGTWRGFLSEIFGLIGWIAAFFIACRFVGYVVPFIPATWPG